MSHAPLPAMQAILDEQRAAPAADFQAMPIAAARALFDRNAAPWNEPLPPMASRDLVAGGIACRLLLPAPRLAGVIVFVHGGGWTFGNIATHERFARLLAQHAGMAVLMPEYRLAPEHPCPAGIDDILAVLAALPAIPEAAGPLVLAGDSAGANIALAVALERPSPAPCFLSLMYGCFAPDFDTASHRDCGDGSFGLGTARMRWYWDNWRGANPDPRAAPLHGVLHGLAPTHLLAAGLDPLRDDSVALAGRLAAAGVPVRLDIVPGVVHGFLQMSARLPAAQSATESLAAAIRAALKKRPEPRG